MWTTVTSVARGVLQDALAGRTPTAFINQAARTNIERARAELRLGEPAAGDALLHSTLERLEDLTSDADDKARKAAQEVLRGVAYSVRAQGLERQGRRDEAARLYEIAVTLFGGLPDSEITPRDRSDYGVALAARGLDEAAKTQLERARADKGDTPEATRHLARLLLDRRETAAAERLLTETLQVTPSDADAHVLMARVQMQRGHPAASATSQQAAYLLLQAGRARDARIVLDNLRDFTGDRQAARGLHAEALRLEGRSAEAATEFEEALAAEPDSPWLLGRYASTLDAMDRPREAVQVVSRAAELAPDDVDILLLSGDIALGKGDVDAALAYSERALQADPLNPLAYVLKVRVQQARGLMEAAFEAVWAGRTLAPQDPALLRLHAELERSIGSGSAVQLLQALCELPAATPADYWDYVDLLSIDETLDRALRAVADALRRWPDDARLVELHGDLLRRNGSFSESIEVLHRATALDPTSARGQLLLALALRSEKPDSDEANELALQSLDESARLAPDWADPHWLRAEILRARHDRDGAVAHLDTALRLEPRHRSALALLAEIRLEEGDPTGAQKLARQLLTGHPDDTVGLLLLARAQHDQNQPHKVLKTLAATPSRAGTDVATLVRARE